MYENRKTRKARTPAERAWRIQHTWERYEERFWLVFSQPYALSPRAFIAPAARQVHGLSV